MKIRSDYVSNSSSSSFMLVGQSFNDEELVKIAKHNKIGGPDVTDYEDWDKYEIVDALEDKFKDLDLDFNYGLENYGEEVCIGMEYADMKQDETRKEFEKRIAGRLEELTGRETVKVECMVDGGFDD